MSEVTPEQQPRRAAYEPPRVEVLGTLQKLTLGSGGAGVDFASELSV